MDHETFVKEQQESVHKALTKNEEPIKPKHAIRLVAGTHQEMSCEVFWKTVNKIDLESNAVVAWKENNFSLSFPPVNARWRLKSATGISSAGRKVELHASPLLPLLRSPCRYIFRIKLAGNRWKYKNVYPWSYCLVPYTNLLVQRLEFHKKYPIVQGNLTMSESDMDDLFCDLKKVSEIITDMMAQMDNLIAMQSETYHLADLTLDGPKRLCLLAPLSLTVTDSCKLYGLIIDLFSKVSDKLPTCDFTQKRKKLEKLFKSVHPLLKRAANDYRIVTTASVLTYSLVPPNFSDGLDPKQIEEQQPNEQCSNKLDVVVSDFEFGATPLTPPCSRFPRIMRASGASHFPDDIPEEKLEGKQLDEEKERHHSKYEAMVAELRALYQHAHNETAEVRKECEVLREELAIRNAQCVELKNSLKEALERAHLAEQRLRKVRTAYENFCNDCESALEVLHSDSNKQ